MRLFVAEVDDGGAVGDYATPEAFADWLRRDWGVTERDGSLRVKLLDEALLSTINTSHVGMVIPFRLGWVFCAEDAPA